MSDDSKIEWTDATWPITVGCTRTAPAGSAQSGCGDASGGGCYAEQSVARVNRCSIGAGRPAPYADLVRLVKRGDRTVARWTGGAKFFPDRLAMPLRWKRPRRIFVSSQSDLFHESLTNEQIAAVFGVMAAAPRHTFQVLTKRAARMRAWFEWVRSAPQITGHMHGVRGVIGEMLAIVDEPLADRAWKTMADARVAEEGQPASIGDACAWPWPLPNVWLGVSVENQAAADERIPELLRTPAAVRWISAEPLLGPVDLLPWFDPTGACDCPPGESYCVGGCAKRASWRHTEPDGEDPNLDWVVMGAESGPGARATDPEWFLELAEQCEDARVPLFFKQGMPSDNITAGDGSKVKAGGIIGLPYLDGRQHLEMPEVRRG